MNKRKLCIAFGSALVFLSVVSGAMASIAWFTVTNGFGVGITGSFVEEYFHTGDGTSANPFVITRPIHYYHLVEFFQRKTSLPGNQRFGTDYLYFQVGYDLDNDGDLEVYEYDNQGIYTGTSDNPRYSNNLNMAYYSGTNSLMPIGTNEIPFIGTFDGKASEGIVISNLNICCSETVEIDGAPVTRTASDIGIFGYVADADTNSTPTVIKDSRFNGVTIDLSDVTTSVASSSTGVTHEDSHAGTAYVGYIAGHVHTYANYQAAVPPASATNATPLHDVYVTNATIQGGAGVHCNYGYIGLVDEIDEKEASTVEGEISEVNTGSGQGQGDDWGGSVDFYNLNQRIKYYLSNVNKTGLRGGTQDSPAAIVKEKSIYTTSYANVYRYYTDDYMSYSTFSGAAYDNDPATNQIIYRFVGGGSPAYSSTSSASGSATATRWYTIPETYVPLATSGIEDGYAIDSKNTGYFAGDLMRESNTVRTASYANTYIGKSIYPFTTNASNYDGSKLEVLSNKSNTYSGTPINDYARINNGIAGNTGDVQAYAATINTSSFVQQGTKYTAAYSKMKEILSESSFVQGLHFTGNVINKDNVATVPKAYINGNLINNYKTLKSSVDFTLKENGYINFFAGSYGNYGTSANPDIDCDSFFSLHTVERDADKNITNTKQIYFIYKNTNQETKSTYPHLYYDDNNNLIEVGYNSSNVTKGELEFDMNFLHNAPPVIQAVYYFEIPVNLGEFALGSVSANKTKGAYLMYLDIGASGEQKEPTVNDENHIDDAPLFTQIDFQINSYVINSCFNVAYVIPAGSTKETFSITISCGTVTHEGNPYTCYEVVIINNSGANFILNALLMDNDNDNNNAYYYMYAIKYNTGERTEYLGSNTFTGASGGSSMTPTYTNSGS